MSQLSNLSEPNALPCSIDISRCLSDAAILATAINVGPFQFKQTLLSEESLPQLLTRIYDGGGKYDMDCTIYSQLESLAPSDKWTVNRSKVVTADEASLDLFCDQKILLLIATDIDRSMSDPNDGKWFIFKNGKLLLEAEPPKFKALTFKEKRSAIQKRSVKDDCRNIPIKVNQRRLNFFRMNSGR